MLRAVHLLPAGTWDKAAQRDEITLDFDARHRRRLRLVGDGGLDFLLDLPEAAVMHQDDGLQLEDGGIVRVMAAREPLLEVRAATAELLMRLVWHVGNRHLPAELSADRFYIRDDHVIADMLRGLGGQVRQVRSAFTPEGGAYRAGHGHAESGHAHDHGHDHADDHAHHGGHRHGHG